MFPAANMQPITIVLHVQDTGGNTGQASTSFTFTVNPG